MSEARLDGAIEVREQEQPPVSRRGFLSKAAVVAATVLVGVPVVNQLFFRGGAGGPKTKQEGQATVMSGLPGAYRNLELVECEWSWPSHFSNPMVHFGVKNHSESSAIREIDVRVMVLGKKGFLLAEEGVTIPSILPGEVCRMGAVVATNVDAWIGGDTMDSEYVDVFDRIVVLIEGAEEVVTGMDFRRDWPYHASFTPRGSRTFASVEVTLQSDDAEKAELGEAVLSAAYLCVVWRDEEGRMTEVCDMYLEGLEVGVARAIDIATLSKEEAAEVHVRPWRRDENSFGVLRGLEVVQQRY